MFRHRPATLEFQPLTQRSEVEQARGQLRAVRRRRTELEAELEEIAAAAGEGGLAKAARVLARQPGRRDAADVHADLRTLADAEREAATELRLATDRATAELAREAGPHIRELEDRAQRALAELAPIAEEALALLTTLRAAGLGDATVEAGALRRLANITAR